jgi:hypothetical protein
VITPEHRQAVIPLVNVHEPLAKEQIRKPIYCGFFHFVSMDLVLIALISRGLSILQRPNQVAQTQMNTNGHRTPEK